MCLTEYDQAYGEDSNRCLGVNDDRRGCRSSEDDVTDDGNQNGELDGSETTEMGIRDVGTKKWHHIGPELVESGETSRGSLTHAQSTRLATEASTGRGSGWKILLNEVGDYYELEEAIHSHGRPSSTSAQ